MTVDIELVRDVDDDLVKAFGRLLPQLSRGARGRGVGAALTREAVRLAREAGARTVDLTSRPSRGAANRLYERLGSELRDSKVYRWVENERGVDVEKSRAAPSQR